MPLASVVSACSNGRPRRDKSALAIGAPRRLRDEEHLRAAYQDLKENGVKIISTINHGVTKSIYFEDPDGNQLEVYCDGLPEEVAKFPDLYAGMEQLDFAKDAPDFKEAIREPTK